MAATFEVSGSSHLFIINVKELAGRGAAGWVTKPRLFMQPDSAKLSTTFANLGYRVHIKDIANREEFNDYIDDVIDTELSGCSSLMVIVSGYGSDGVIFCNGGPIKITEVCDNFDAVMCEILAGKPKIFIFQTCNPELYGLAEKEDGEQAVSTDGDRVHLDVTDIHITQSLVPGAVPWRRAEEGSMFFGALCQVVDKVNETPGGIEWNLVLNRTKNLVEKELMSKAMVSYRGSGPRLCAITDTLCEEFHLRNVAP